MNFTPVKSSQIKEVAHDSESNTLYIRFKRKDELYKYHPISKEDFKDFSQSESVGRYFHKKIKHLIVVEDIKQCEMCDKRLDSSGMINPGDNNIWFCDPCYQKINN